MPKLPIHFDELFSLGIVLLFLMINYNLELSSIYVNMVYLVLFGYLIPIIFNLFEWIPLYNRRNVLNELIAGVGAAIVFLWFYNFLQTPTPLATVFATTALGESMTVGMVTYTALIPPIETIFFFVIIPSWILWKTGKSLINRDITSRDSILTAAAIAGVFMIFHWTAKGITNTPDLVATFAFGALSMGLIYYFKSAVSAILMHIIVNGKAVGIVEFFQQSAIFSSQFLVIGGFALVAYLLYSKKLKIPGVV